MAGKSRASSNGRNRELAAERHRAKVKIRLIEAATTVAVRLIPWTAIVVVVSLMRDAAMAFAGTETRLEGFFAGIVDLKVNEAFAYLVATVCGAGYWRERVLRLRTISQLAPFAKMYEEKIDANRSSSGLA